MALASETQVGVLDYLLNRREKLVSITEEFNDIAITVAKQVNTESEYFKNWELSVLPQYDPTLKFGEIISSNIAAYEYTYVYHGNTYHVYQVLGADMLKGYVFTYTALENEYNEHIDEIKTILGKVSFK